MASVSVRLFATARRAVGRGRLDWPVPVGGLRARQLVRALEEAHPSLGPVLRTSRFLRNGRYLGDLDVVLRPGDELAVHPPYAGG